MLSQNASNKKKSGSKGSNSFDKKKAIEDAKKKADAEAKKKADEALKKAAEER